MANSNETSLQDKGLPLVLVLMKDSLLVETKFSHSNRPEAFSACRDLHPDFFEKDAWRNGIYSGLGLNTGFSLYRTGGGRGAEAGGAQRGSQSDPRDGVAPPTHDLLCLCSYTSILGDI